MIGRSVGAGDSLYVDIRSPHNDIEFEAYYELRWRVLRKPWGEARGTEYDEYDRTATHIAAFNDSKNLVGVGRLQLVEGTLGQVRYMAVEPVFRKQGVGQLILLELEKQAKKQGMTDIFLEDEVSFQETPHPPAASLDEISTISMGHSILNLTSSKRIPFSCLGL